MECWSKPLHQLVAAVAHEKQIDVLILLECKTPFSDLLKALNSAGKKLFHFPNTQTEAVRIFTRFSSRFLRPIHEGSRFSIRHLTLPAQRVILLAAVHFPSKLFWSEDSQAQECAELARNISAAEHRVGHSRTVLVGDMNMNPFEKGIVGTVGFRQTESHSTPSR